MIMHDGLKADGANHELFMKKGYFLETIESGEYSDIGEAVDIISGRYMDLHIEDVSVQPAFRNGRYVSGTYAVYVKKDSNGIL